MFGGGTGWECWEPQVSEVPALQDLGGSRFPLDFLPWNVEMPVTLSPGEGSPWSVHVFVKERIQPRDTI